MAYTISKGEKDFWQVFEDGFARVTFNSQEDAEYWAKDSKIEYTVE
jgi:hypothetical protein